MHNTLAIGAYDWILVQTRQASILILFHIRFLSIPRLESAASNLPTKHKHRNTSTTTSLHCRRPSASSHIRGSPLTVTLSYPPIDYASHASSRATPRQASPSPRKMSRPGVHFAPTPEFSRQPTGDELALFHAFADHQYVCSTCDLRHRSLCDRGHELAAYIAQRIYYHDGKTFSSKDREHSVPVQIEIPLDCSSVRTLLKALERRNRKAQQQSAQPAQSYDRTYYVPPRPVQYAVPQSPQYAVPQSPQYAVPQSPPYYPAPAPVYANKSPYYIPVQYPAPLPLPPRTRRRYSVSQQPAQDFTIYEPPEPAYGYYR